MIAFDKAAAPLMQMVDMMGDAPIERQFRVVRHIVERLTVTVGVPEPTTMAMLSLAVVGLGGYVRRRRRA